MIFIVRRVAIASSIALVAVLLWFRRVDGPSRASGRVPTVPVVVAAKDMPEGEIADRMAATFPGVYRLLLNKYYVDEIYDATVVQPIRIVSQEGLWRGVDVHIIDAAVNGTASIVDGSSSLLRRLQSGSVRAYAGSLFIGVVLILGYYLWR